MPNSDPPATGLGTRELGLFKGGLPSPEPFAVLDAKGRIVAASYSWGSTGMNPYIGAACDVGSDYREHCRKVSNAELASAVAEVLDGRRHRAQILYSLGSGRQAVEWRAQITRVQGSREAAAIVEHQDLTERLQMEERLRQSARQFRAILIRSCDVVTIKNLSGRYVLINPAGVEAFGKRQDEILGKTDAEIFGPELGRLRSEADRRVAESQKTIAYEKSFDTATGRRTFHTTKFPYVSEAGEMRGVIEIGRDVTEARRLAEQLQHSQKMEAIGRLAGGIAHDFNNILTALQGYCDLLLQEVPTGSPMREDIEEVRGLGKRAAALTAQLLAFSRRQLLQPTTLDLNGVVTETQKMLRRLIGEDIDLAIDMAPDLGMVRADRGQLELVLVNLAVNARDAMAKGGKLTILTRNVEVRDDAEARAAGLKAGAYVKLTVSDTGIGMTEETLAHLFEPFFTTKPKGKGTGLGLSTAYGIITQSGGRIAVRSAPGKGAGFDIYLPRVYDAAAVGPKSSTQIQLRPGKETILLVEDEPAVRKMLRRFLVGGGYAVLEAADGADALKVASEHAGRIDLVISDVVMPRMGGEEMAKRLESLRPGIKTIFISGYTESGVIRRRAAEQDVVLLQKPFKSETLLAKVRVVLDG